MSNRFGRRPIGLAILACVVFTALALTGGAAAEGEHQPLAENLVEIKVADRVAIDELIADAEALGAEFNDHYLRLNEDDGTVTVQILGDDAQIEALRKQGYEILATIEDEQAYLDRIGERARAIELERRAHEVAEEGRSADLQQAGLRAGVAAAALASEITVNRVDYFENYAGRFLSVEAFNRDTVQQTGGGQTAGQGPTMAVTWDSGPGTEIGSGGGPRNMAPYIDPDPAQDTYLYHRLLVRIGGLNSPNTPPKPARIRIASSSGAFEEADVETWLGQSLPPNVAGYQIGFHNRYMDPTEVYGAMNQLATEYPNLAQMINAPFKTNGYQRRAQVTMGTYVTPTLGAAAAAGASSIRLSSTANLSIGSRIAVEPGTPNQEVRTIASFVSPNPAAPAPNVNLTEPLALAHASGAPVQGEPGAGTSLSTAAGAGAVVLTSRAWGHQGGNDISAEFRNPGAPDSPLTVSVIGKDITVNLRTDSTGAIASTATEVIDAINAHPGASALVKATPYRNSAANAVVAARWRINLSDFLAVSQAVPASGIPHDNSHVQRGPFQPQVMRIGKVRDGSKVGIYLFCQQHAREWVTPITCYETAARLLKNYATDPLTRDIVDNLDIFIMPSVNPDGAHYSFYNFQSQRRNMTNHCVVGGKAADDPFGPSFWTPRTNPGTGTAYTQNDPSSRNVWGVDLNRNQSVGTIFDGYVGASHNCNSDVFAGPEEVSEPEAKNEAWVVDVLGPNIKFSNNIHTSGGYFMWAPGAYKPTRETLPAPNIGIEKYFFAAAETVLGRIKEYRGNAVLPERTGPIADVLYSAAGNSADDNYYRKGIIGYSFEAGSDLFVAPTLTVAANAGDTGVRVSSTAGMGANDTITIDRNGASPEIRRIASIPSPSPASPNPNVILQTPLGHAHSTGAVIDGGTARQGVGFFPNYGTEGRHEANEFAAGNFGLLEAALAYSRDKTAPQVAMTGPRASQTPIRTTFEYVNEPSVIHYTVDGSTPTFDSPKWERQGLRRPGEVFEFTQTTTVRWLALDLAGNTSTGSARFAVDTAAPTSSASAEPSRNGGFATVTITSDDNVAGGGSGIDEIRYRVDGGAWQTYSGPFAVFGNGTRTVEYHAIDLAGNVEATKSITFEVTTPARALERCRMAIGPKTVRAGQRTVVRVTVKAGQVEVDRQRVTLRGPGVSRSVRTNAAGVATVAIRPSKAGTLRVSVPANAVSLACSASKRILAAPKARRKSGVAGTGTGGAALTGRP